MHKNHAFPVQKVHFGQMTLKTTIWVSISLIGLSNPEKPQFSLPKRNLHGGPFAPGHPHWHLSDGDGSDSTVSYNYDELPDRSGLGALASQDLATIFESPISM